MIRRKEFTDFQLKTNDAINALKLEILSLKHELEKGKTSVVENPTEVEKVQIEQEQERRDRILAAWSEDPETIAEIYGAKNGR